jgi:uncharacterized protein (DUF58 family)
MAEDAPGDPPVRAPLFHDLRFSRDGAWTLFAGILFLGAGVLTASWTVSLWGQAILGVVVVARLAAARDETALSQGGLTVRAEEIGSARVGRALSLSVAVEGDPGPTELRLSVAPELGLKQDTTSLEAPGTATFDALPLRAGRPFVHGVRLLRRPWPGLFEAEAWFPLNAAVRVLPSVGLAVGIPQRLARTDDLKEASRRVNRAGIGSEFREIRDHRPGDPYRAIAWKASARRGRLLVREFDDESRITLRLLLDTSPSMRAGAMGRTPLDGALSLCARIIESLLNSGDRVGLVTFDQRAIACVEPGAGKLQRRRLMTTLPGVFDVVDADLVAPDPSELERRVADHLRYQWGLEVRRAGLLDDELLDAVTRHVVKRQSGDRVPPGADPVREYCRLFGPALPYRAVDSVDDLDTGLSAAVAKALSGRRGPATLLLVSDLRGRPGPGLNAALAMLRSRRHRLLVLAPLVGTFAQRPETDRAAQIHDLVTWSDDPAGSPFARRLKAAGVPIVTLGASDPLAPLLRRLARLRLAS